MTDGNHQNRGGGRRKAFLVLGGCLVLCVGLFVYLAWDDITNPKGAGLMPVTHHPLNT